MLLGDKFSSLLKKKDVLKTLIVHLIIKNLTENQADLNFM